MMQWLAEGNALVLQVLVALGIVYLIFGLDDLVIDLVALFGRLGPRKLSGDDMKAMGSSAQKTIAVLVPAWKEGNIIDRMLAGNIQRIDYSRYHFFVGVYPNDLPTVEQVRKVQRQFPNVHPVVNFKDGPTSKGQILNHVIRQILDFERESGLRFDAFLMQDAEDLIHPKTLQLVNRELETYDFVQVPVFSLEVKARELIAGTYVDEFAESHTKDILVREKLGAAIPSAGVGTGMSRRLVLEMLLANERQLFNEGSLTEDYELGVRAHNLGFKPHVACSWYQHPETGRPEFIATREFFPKQFARSVRQKTRWTVGIALQGWRNLGWIGNAGNLYFLARDRKGILTNVATFVGYPCAAASALYSGLVDAAPANELFGNPFLQGAFAVNASLMALRLLQRMRCVARVYGVRAALPIPVRWPVGNAVNALAALHAIKNDFMARFTKVSLAWVKTEHELPTYFGQPVTASASST